MYDAEPVVQSELETVRARISAYWRTVHGPALPEDCNHAR
jgi:hypothetical protein